jgi:hypothetical protein
MLRCPLALRGTPGSICHLPGRTGTNLHAFALWGRYCRAGCASPALPDVPTPSSLPQLTTLNGLHMFDYLAYQYKCTTQSGACNGLLVLCQWHTCITWAATIRDPPAQHLPHSHAWWCRFLLTLVVQPIVSLGTLLDHCRGPSHTGTRSHNQLGCSRYAKTVGVLSRFDWSTFCPQPHPSLSHPCTSGFCAVDGSGITHA